MTGGLSLTIKTRDFSVQWRRMSWLLPRVGWPYEAGGNEVFSFGLMALPGRAASLGKQMGLPQ